MNQEVLKTKAVYKAQIEVVVAEEIEDLLDEFGIRSKDASNMNVAVQKLDLIKIGCFAHTLNLGAQSMYQLPQWQNVEQRFGT